MYGYFCSPLRILKEILAATGSSAIIPYKKSMDGNQRQTFGSPWDTDICRAYSRSVSPDHAVLVELYSNRATLERSATQSGQFLRAGLANIRGYSEQGITVGFAPIAKLLPTDLPTANLRRMKMVRMKSFVHVMFKDVIIDFYSGVAVAGQLHTP